MLLVTDVMPVSTELPAIISTSALSVAIIQWMKGSKLFTFINHDTPGMNRALCWIAAFISGVGIHYNYDPALGALTITGLTFSSIVSAGMQSAKSYAFNWLIYNVSGMKNKSAAQNQPPAVPSAPAEGGAKP